MLPQPFTRRLPALHAQYQHTSLAVLNSVRSL